MSENIPIFELRGPSLEEMKAEIVSTLQSRGLYSDDLLYRFFSANRIPDVLDHGNDRVEGEYDLSPLEVEAAEHGYDVTHTLWADTLDNMDFWTCEGRNLLLFSGISVYDKSKTMSRCEMRSGWSSPGGGEPSYHVISTEDPRDALVAVFKRNNSPLLHFRGLLGIALQQGPRALYETLQHDWKNLRRAL